MTERTPEQYVERGEEHEVHDLKTWPVFYEALLDGTKTFEARVDDRGFCEGDILHLREWDDESEEYTGREMLRRVTYLMNAEEWVAPGVVIMGLGSASDFDRRSSTTEPRALVYQMRDGLDCGCIPGHCKGHPPASPSVTWERPVAPEGENPYGLPSEWMERYLKDAVLHYGVQALTASTDPKQTLALLVRMLQQGVVAPEPVTDGEDADGYETRVIARAASDGDYSDLARLLYYNAHDKPFTEAIYFTERHLRTFAARLRARETPPEVVGYVAVAWAIEDHITWDADEGAEWIEEFGEFPETFGGVQTLYRRALPEDGGGES